MTVPKEPALRQRSGSASLLVSRLAAHERDRLAAVDETGTITYGALLDRAGDLAGRIGSGRVLAVLECETSIDWLIAYVALQLGGHVTLLAPKGAGEQIEQVARNYAAGVMLSVAGGYAPERLAAPAPVLHPDLSILLLTSGSTGSPKCVRLSQENIASNAQAIARYLGISPDERGVVNLPVHYSYGMSIVNSHLWAGASLLLTSRSVVEPEFWAFCRAHGASSFAGVPHTYDLLARIDFPRVAPPSLRYFTQAGGRLAPERVRELGELAETRGWRFYVMYGQTEAAPRMAYLPPEALARHAGAIGMAIPGGSLAIRDEDGRDLPPGTVGELVYEGPNVMMGYAFSHLDLGAAPGPRLLRTGDLAKATEDGFFYITGRKSRFVKIFGTRIGLDEVEGLCLEAGFPVVATGNDETLLVVTREDGRAEEISALLQDRLKLPGIAIEVRRMPEYPVLPTGKVDYAALRASIAARQGAGVSGARRVQDVYRAVLGPQARDEALSFNDLKGDSLTFVRVSLELEEMFGPLPERWHEMPAAALQDHLAQARVPPGKAQSVSGGILGNVDTLRALACLMVVTSHVFGITGNSGLNIADDSPWRLPFVVLDPLRMPLFTALAGVLYAALPAPTGGFRGIVANRFLTLIVPAVVVALVYFGIRSAAGMSGPPLYPRIFYGYLHLWYLYALFEIAVVVAAIDLFLRPSVRGWLGVILGFYLMSLFLPWTPFRLGIGLAPYYILGLVLFRTPALLANRGLMALAVAFAVVGVTVQWLDFAGRVEQSRWLLPVFSTAFVLVTMRFMPRLRTVEWIGVYSYAIYLWHPAANAALREVLQRLGIEGIPVLFALGTIVGVFVPIAMHFVLSRGPYPVRLALVGR